MGYVWLINGKANDFGYALKSDVWHRGFATEAAGAVMQRIEEAGYPYLTATHDVKNPKSGAVMKKLGMHYRYSYVEQWQPWDIPVTFRMYQRNFDGEEKRCYQAYWNAAQEHFVEKGL